MIEGKTTTSLALPVHSRSNFKSARQRNSKLSLC